MDLREQLERYDDALASLGAEHDIEIGQVSPPRHLDWSELARIGVDVLANDDVMRSVRFMLTSVEDHGHQIFAGTPDGFPSHCLITEPDAMAYFYEMMQVDSSWPRLVVPMFEDGAGNHLVIDLDPASATYGWLFDYDHETREFKAVASSLAGMVAASATLAELGFIEVADYGFLDYVHEAAVEFRRGISGMPDPPASLQPKSDPQGFEFTLPQVNSEAPAAPRAPRAPHSPSDGLERAADSEAQTKEAGAEKPVQQASDKDEPTLVELAAEAISLFRGVKKAAQDGLEAAKKAWDDEQRENR